MHFACAGISAIGNNDLVGFQEADIVTKFQVAAVLAVWHEVDAIHALALDWVSLLFHLVHPASGAKPNDLYKKWVKLCKRNFILQYCGKQACSHLLAGKRILWLTWPKSSAPSNWPQDMSLIKLEQYCHQLRVQKPLSILCQGFLSSALSPSGTLYSSCLNAVLQGSPHQRPSLFLWSPYS